MCQTVSAASAPSLSRRDAVMETVESDELHPDPVMDTVESDPVDSPIVVQNRRHIRGA